MQNRSLENTVYVLAAGAFGVFIRWLQLQLAFDEKGLCGPSVFNVIVPVFLLVVAWVLRRRIRQMLKEQILPEEYGAVLENRGKLYAFLRWMLGAMMAAGGALVIRGSEVEKQVVMLRILGGLAILTGICFPIYLGWANRELKPRQRALLCLIALAPILLFALWLVYDGELSYAQAAKVLGCGVKKIDNLLANGKKRLRQELEKEGITHADI